MWAESWVVPLLCPRFRDSVSFHGVAPAIFQGLGMLNQFLYSWLQRRTVPGCLADEGGCGEAWKWQQLNRTRTQAYGPTWLKGDWKIWDLYKQEKQRLESLTISSRMLLKHMHTFTTLLTECSESRATIWISDLGPWKKKQWALHGVSWPVIKFMEWLLASDLGFEGWLKFSSQKGEGESRQRVDGPRECTGCRQWRKQPRNK